MSSHSLRLILHCALFCVVPIVGAAIPDALSYGSGTGDLLYNPVTTSRCPQPAESAPGTTAFPEYKSDAIAGEGPSSIGAAYHDSTFTPDHNVVVASHAVSPVSGGVAVGSTILRPGGNGLTTEGVVYSAASGHRLIIVSSSYLSAPTPSSTNAYQVLSSAVQTASPTSAAGTTMVMSTDSSTDRQSTALPAVISGQSPRSSKPLVSGSTVQFSALPSTQSTILPEIVTTPSASTASEAKRIVLTIGMSTITALAQVSGAVQFGGDLLVPGGSDLTSDGHVFSVVSAGIIEDGTMMLFSAPSPSDATSGAVSTLGSSTPTTTPSPGSGKVSPVSTTLTSSGSALVSAGNTISATSSSGSEDGSLVTFKTSFAPESSESQALVNSSLPSITHEVTPSRGVWGNGVPTPSTTSGANHAHPEIAMSVLAAVLLLFNLM